MKIKTIRKDNNQLVIVKDQLKSLKGGTSGITPDHKTIIGG